MTNIKLLNNILSVSFVISLVIFNNCGPSKKQIEEQKRIEKLKQKEIKQEEKNKNWIDAMGGITLSEQSFSTSSSTLEIQRFVDTISNKIIIFNGYVLDIEEVDKKIFIEFVSPVGNKILTDLFILFRLEIPVSDVDQFLGHKPNFLGLRLHMLSSDGFLIASRIEDIKKVNPSILPSLHKDSDGVDNAIMVLLGNGSYINALEL